MFSLSRNETIPFLFKFRLYVVLMESTAVHMTLLVMSVRADVSDKMEPPIHGYTNLQPCLEKWKMFIVIHSFLVPLETLVVN